MAYGYKATITIDADQVSGTGDLASFPFPVFGTYDGTGGEPDLRHTTHGGKVTSTSGYDIIFTSDAAGTTQLDHEIEFYTHDTGYVLFWVEVPTLDGDADTVIYMWYGDSGVTTSQEDINGTWDANYLGVWHMSESDTPMQDSTSNNLDITLNYTYPAAKGNYVFRDTTNTILGANVRGTSVQDGLAVPDNDLLDQNDITIEGWVYVTNTAAQYPAYFGRWSGDDLLALFTPSWNSNHYDIRCHTSGTHPAQIFTTVDGIYNAWVHAVYRYDSSIHEFSLWLNGTEVYTNSADFTGNAPQGHADFNIMGLLVDAHNAGEPGFGLIGSGDEYRFSKVARTDEWIVTTYNSISSPSTFYAMGSETAAGGSSAAISTRQMTTNSKFW